MLMKSRLCLVRINLVLRWFSVELKIFNLPTKNFGNLEEELKGFSRSG
jgi:hypothetical protein